MRVSYLVVLLAGFVMLSQSCRPTANSAASRNNQPAASGVQSISNDSGQTMGLVTDDRGLKTLVWCRSLKAFSVVREKAQNASSRVIVETINGAEECTTLYWTGSYQNMIPCFVSGPDLNILMGTAKNYVTSYPKYSRVSKIELQKIWEKIDQVFSDEHVTYQDGEIPGDSVLLTAPFLDSFQDLMDNEQVQCRR